jgi:hypothetical protein
MSLRPCTHTFETAGERGVAASPFLSVGMIYRNYHLNKQA